eukprot:1157343-Pelagomonas_calceolata.AAC.8
MLIGAGAGTTSPRVGQTQAQLFSLYRNGALLASQLGDLQGEQQAAGTINKRQAADQLQIDRLRVQRIVKWFPGACWGPREWMSCQSAFALPIRKERKEKLSRQRKLSLHQ